MSLPENIDAILVKYDITASALARIAKVDESTVSKWRKGTQMRKEPMKRIMAYFGLTEDDLVSDCVGFAAKEHGRYGLTGYATVPLLGRIAAGTPIPMDNVEDSKEAPARFRQDDPNVFMLRVDGDSVNRIIPNGNFALISPKYREPNEHDLFAVCVNGHDATIKHVKKLANGYMLIPDSYDPTIRPKIFDYNDTETEEITIIGKVVWACMPF